MPAGSNKLVENLADYLAAGGVGTVATNIFIGGLTDSPDDQVNLNASGGVEPNRENPIKQPTVQITVRNIAYDTGLLKITTIYDLLHQLNDAAVLASGGVDVMNCFALQEPTHLMKDESDRHIFVCNFVFMLRGSD